MNTTTNGSVSCSIQKNPTAYKFGATVAYCLIFVVSLVGNSFIGIVVYKTKTLRKPMDIFIVNMAMSDLLTPLIYIPLEVASLYRYSWLISGVLGNALCKLSPFLFDVSLVVSVQSLVLIAVGRLEAVVCPLRSPLISSKRCPLFILATWIIATAANSPLLFAYGLKKHEEGVFCNFMWEDTFGESLSSTDFNLAMHVAFFNFPMILLIVIYSIILIKLKLQKRPGQPSRVAEKQRQKQNKNVLEMAIAIVLGLLLCRLPWIIIDLIERTAGDTLPCGFFIYTEILDFLFVSYCVVNPCICFVFSRNYREGLKRLLKCGGF
ncbi:QRFP-like peptide receptor [Montipora capricornis]|uniref:QRFP-like peptide receptor n=1 Tax=Montipora capricornis TaxID=246305 RepID=UPI0035F2186B